MKFQWSLDVQLGERENQEDSSACRLGRKPGRAVFIVADGMGGHEAGEEASKAAVSAALAAVMAGKVPVGAHTLVTLSGGNVDADLFAKVLTEAG